jgi:hypothetical protein
MFFAYHAYPGFFTGLKEKMTDGDMGDVLKSSKGFRGFKSSVNRQFDWTCLRNYRIICGPSRDLRSRATPTKWLPERRADGHPQPVPASLLEDCPNLDTLVLERSAHWQAAMV